MGNFVNGCVILIVMAIYNLTGPNLDPIDSRNTIMIQFAVGAAVSVFLVLWRYFRLKESEVRSASCLLVIVYLLLNYFPYMFGGWVLVVAVAVLLVI